MCHYLLPLPESMRDVLELNTVKDVVAGWPWT